MNFDELLFKAIRSGHLKKVKLIMDLNSWDKKLLDTALIRAAMYGNVEIMEYLLENYPATKLDTLATVARYNENYAVYEYLKQRANSVVY